MHGIIAPESLNEAHATKAAKVGTQDNTETWLLRSRASLTCPQNPLTSLTPSLP